MRSFRVYIYDLVVERLRRSRVAICNSRKHPSREIQFCVSGGF